MTQKPTFGVVILNWNNAGDTLECLESLLQCQPRPELVVLVDNGSHDDSVSRIEEWWSRERDSGDSDWLTVTRAGSNLGFAGGTNLGIRKLMAVQHVSHVLLLNNDTITPANLFSELSRAVEQSLGAGILGPTIRKYPDTNEVWYAGAKENYYRALVQHTIALPPNDEPLKTDFVTGCAMLIAREVIETIGELAECYFPAYFEDGDFCHRARRAGFDVVYAPRPVVYHKIGSTVTAMGLSRELTYAKNRLRVIYVRRNYRGFTKLAALAYLAVTKPSRAVVEAMKGKPAIGWQIFSGTISGFVSGHAHT